MSNRVSPKFNDLVRMAYDAQEEFDQWDDGWGGETSEHALEHYSRAWSEANLALIQYVVENYLELVAEQSEDA